MKVVRMILIGSVLSVLYHVSNVGLANDVFAEPYITYQSLTLDISFPLNYHSVDADNFVSAIDTDFLLAHQLAGGYTMGVKYLDFNVADELRVDTDQSQLWIGLQFSF